MNFDKFKRFDNTIDLKAAFESTLHQDEFEAMEDDGILKGRFDKAVEFLQLCETYKPVISRQVSGVAVAFAHFVLSGE